MKLRLIGAILLAAALAAPARAATPHVTAISFVAEVNPVTQDWLNHQLQHAADRRDAAAVILLDTPGGLEDSMRKIVQKELALPIPVIVYVSPNGARAASAGVWISQAADVLAMAPETNIGSSTPISGTGANIGSDLRRKIVNDAAASLRSLMRAHHRNAAWGDKAVRVASNLSADEAKQTNVIDAMAPNLPALLNQVDGRTTIPAGHTLHTADAEIVNASPGFLTRFLSTLLDPNLISLLFLAGLAGIGFEIFHPGVVLPGALGGVSLLLALLGFAVVPPYWAGLVLVLLGIGLLIVDAHVTSHGALSVSGLVSLAVGAMLLFHNTSGFHTSLPLVVTVAVLLGSFWAFALTKAVQVRRRPVTVGPQEILGMHGVVRDGLVAVRGELWQARSATDEPLVTGEEVVVEHLDGLTLVVRPAGKPASVA